MLNLSSQLKNHRTKCLSMKTKSDPIQGTQVWLPLEATQTLYIIIWSQAKSPLELEALKNTKLWQLLKAHKILENSIMVSFTLVTNLLT